MGEDPSLVVASDAIEHIEVTVRFQAFTAFIDNERIASRALSVNGAPPRF